MNNNNGNGGRLSKLVKWVVGILVVALLLAGTLGACAPKKTSATAEEVSELQQEYDALQEDVKSMEEQKTGLQAEISELEEQRESLQKEVATLAEDEEEEAVLMVSLTFYDAGEAEYEAKDESAKFYADPYLTQMVSVDILDSFQKWTMDLSNGNTVTAYHGYYYTVDDEITTYQRGMLWTSTEVTLIPMGEE